MIKELLNKKCNVEKELIDTHKCRFMGIVNTYDIILKDKDNFKYPKSILNKEFGGASILPVDKEGNVYLEIQYRFPIREAIIELPAGRSDEGETFFDCAKRELKEETGCTTDKIINQIELFAQPEFTNEKLGSFLAVECNQTDGQHLDSDETVYILKMPYEGAIELVKRNVIKDERTIVVRVGTEIVSDDRIDNTLQRVAGKEIVHIEIRDNGKGISDQYLGEIFQPMFTHGKENGTGLGLSVVKKIVEDHQGKIKAVSVCGTGTAIHIYLPVLNKIKKNQTTCPTCGVS